MTTMAFEGNDTLRQRMEQHGVGANLVQTFVDSREHSYLGDPIYPPLFEALLKWVEQGIKPTPLGIANRCKEMAMQQQINLCRFAPDYAPRPLASRIAPR